MKVCVFGLWHLGCVTSACLASIGHQVIGLDFDEDAIDNLQANKAPIFEPGLQDLLKAGIDNGNLNFTSNPTTALQDSQIIWVTFDTPVDENDHANNNFVIEQVVRVFPYIQKNALILISSQLPVGSTARLEAKYSEMFPEQQLPFAYSPENLRLGKAIEVFTNPDRVVVGIRDESYKEPIAELLGPITGQIVWMGIESAEMTKHAINAFLATSVTFINEIASLCEEVGANAGEVERGLKTEQRIGPYAYLRPGGSFAGGTLARDVRFLQILSETHQLSSRLLGSITESNDNHKSWPLRRLKTLLGSLDGKEIAVLGLTYKPNTNTLRRSQAVELCLALHEQGSIIRVHDPSIKLVPQQLQGMVEISDSVEDALTGADAMVIMTEWPVYRELNSDDVLKWMHTPIVLDANRFLQQQLSPYSQINYYTVGIPKI